ncbi:Uma2 family endonuclease [Synechocystis sp. LKSZ1]|uniref:Uma2 family endonuclease n=1 Tax=Synechocystis sp. LKSZ1 TaxID=3144951 RepID=UPI00336BB52A
MFVQEKTDSDLKPEKNLITLEAFWHWYPDGYEGRFELHNGVIVKMQPTGTHEQVAGFLSMEIGFEIKRLNLPLFIPRQGLVKAINTDKSGYIPDVMVLDNDAVKNNELLWEKRSTIIEGSTIKLAIEVVSTNWQDDYLMKLGEYEKLGIEEYWIVDYLGLGGRRYIGEPKQPTISVFHLVEGEYVFELFQGQNMIKSLCFPELRLTAEQIFNIGQE